MQQAMQAYVFAPNDGQTWSAVQSALSGILTTAWQQGILMGPTASDAFSVTSQPTAQQILNGYLTCAVSMQLAGGTNFSTTLTQSMDASG
jgi:phage tail sheath protein FI